MARRTIPRVTPRRGAQVLADQRNSVDDRRWSHAEQLGAILAMHSAMVNAWTCKYPTGCSAVVTNRIANVYALEMLTASGVRFVDAALLVFSKQEAMQKADAIAGHRSAPGDWSSISRPLAVPRRPAA